MTKSASNRSKYSEYWVKCSVPACREGIEGGFSRQEALERARAAGFTVGGAGKTARCALHQDATDVALGRGIVRVAHAFFACSYRHCDVCSDATRMGQPTFALERARAESEGWYVSDRRAFCPDHYRELTSRESTG